MATPVTIQSFAFSGDSWTKSEITGLNILIVVGDRLNDPSHAVFAQKMSDIMQEYLRPPLKSCENCINVVKTTFASESYFKASNCDENWLKTQHIRIGFGLQGVTGNWSYVGRNCLNIPPRSITTHVEVDFSKFLFNRENGVSKSVCEGEKYNEDVFGTLRHEFGHALGLEHGHQNSSAVQQLGGLRDAQVKNMLKSIHKQVYGESDAVYDARIDSKFRSNYVPNNKNDIVGFDRRSVMNYYIKQSFTANGIGMDTNNTISPGDHLQIALLYPPQTKSLSEELVIVSLANESTLQKQQLEIAAQNEAALKNNHIVEINQIKKGVTENVAISSGLVSLGIAGAAIACTTPVGVLSFLAVQGTLTAISVFSAIKAANMA